MTDPQIIDLSRTLQPGMPETPALPRFSAWWYLQQSLGDAVDLQAMFITEHTGTNVDAPRHVIPEGETIDNLPLDAFIGPALVLDLRYLEPLSEITVEILQAAEAEAERTIEAGDIVLLMTGHDDRHWSLTPTVYRDMKKRPALTVGAADYLVEREIKALGVDTTSPDISGTPLPVHHRLLGNGVRIIEGLTRLDRIPPGKFFFMALPLKIHGGTGSPVRAIAVTGPLEALMEGRQESA